MTDNCIIGPIKIPAAHLEDDNTFSDGKEEFTLLTTHKEALQLQGLASKTQRTDYGNTSVISTEKSGWGLVPLDTSVELYDNEDWTHRGYYLIDTVEPTPQSGMYMQSKVSAEKVANTGEYLTMHYTPGYNDGTVQPYNYEPSMEIINTLMDKHWNVGTSISANMEGCGSWLGCGWPNGWAINLYNSNDPYGNMYASPAISKVVMSGIASGNGQPGWMTYSTNQEFSPPWTLEFDLEWNHYTTDSIGGEFMPSVFIGWHANYRPEDWKWASYDVNGSVIRFYLFVRNNVTYAAAYINKPGRTDLNYLWAYQLGQLTVDQKKVRYKVQYLNGGIMTVWLDKDGGSNWTKMWGPSSTGLNWKNPAFGMGIETRPWTRDTNNLGLRAYNDEFKVYRTSLAYANNNNVIALPAGTDVELETTPDFTRTSEDGNIPIYLNPTKDLDFRANEDSFYYGSVKAYSNNYRDNAYRQIIRDDEVVNFYTLPCMYVKNGLVKLEPTDDGVKFYYWNPSTSTYVWDRTYDIGDVKTMKMLYISPERCTFQINNTKWTLARGKPFCKVEHPNVDIGYTIGSYYVHDGVTTTAPSVGASISMGTVNYTNIYNNTTDTYRSQIYQLNPTTITSTNIPAADVTGIAVYNNTEVSTSYNHPSNLANEFIVQPQTSIGVK